MAARGAIHGIDQHHHHLRIDRRPDGRAAALHQSRVAPQHHERQRKFVRSALVKKAHCYPFAASVFEHCTNSNRMVKSQYVIIDDTRATVNFKTSSKPLQCPLRVPDMQCTYGFKIIAQAVRQQGTVARLDFTV